MKREALPQGLLPMHGEGFNGKTTAAEVAITTSIYNEPRELTQRFFGEKNPGTLLAMPFEDGSEIRLHKATGPYAPHHLMLIAHGPDFSSLPKDEPIKTQNIYNYPRDVQTQYWNVLLNGVNAYKEVLGPEYRVFATGNWLNNFSNFEERNARTIGLPHDHICAIKEGQVKPYVAGGVEAIDGYTVERQTTNELLPTALPRIQKRLTSTSTKLQPRTELPYGYSFIVPQKTTLEQFTDLMRDHHEAYTQETTRIKTIFDKRGKVSPLTQPSYQLYIELDEEDNRHISISPSFGGPIGALEAAGVQSKRSQEHPHIVAPEVVKATQEKVAEQVAKTLEKNRTIHKNIKI